MKYIKIFFFLSLLVLSISGVAFAAENFSEEDVGRAIDNAKTKRSEIESACRRDPYVCSCEVINCEDILGNDDTRSKMAYDKCISEKSSCESQRKEGIRQMEEQKSSIERACRKDLNKCDCSSVMNEEGKKKCELAIIEAKYQAEKERSDKIKICTADINKCDCSTISDENGKRECEEKLVGAKELRVKMEKVCRENLGACDCTVIESEEGRSECESKKKEAMAEASGEIKLALSKCFRDVSNCKCDALGLKDQNYVEFCDIQKSYGLSCKNEGLNCEKLDAIEIYPKGMPVWLGKLFAGSYKDYVQAEKEKGLAEAANLISACVRTPGECDCNKIPSYARAFCERNRSLQVKCENEDYDACMILDKSPNLPEGTPAFTFAPLDRLINGLRQMQSGLIQGNAARKVGNMIMSCMDDPTKCDCSIAPSGSIRAFCENKKLLIERCLNNKNYDACFTLSEEGHIPLGTPAIIANYIENNVTPEIKKKEQVLFNKMKKGTSCANISTIGECKKVLQAK